MNNNYIGYEITVIHKSLFVREYLRKIKLNLKDIATNLQKSCTRNIQLTIAINFISSKDNDEEPVMIRRVVIWK